MTDEYLKVLNTIYSCTTEQQLLVTKRMVGLLEQKHGAEYRSLHTMCEVKSGYIAVGEEL